MSVPLGVAVDRHGNIFEADDGGSLPINEYFQDVNAVSQSCTSPNEPLAVAVDASGDVFLATPGGIYEYIGGLPGCSPTLLNNIEAFGMALDSNNNLIVSTETGFQSGVPVGAVEVLDPPYTSVSSSIGSGFTVPIGLSVNKKNKLVFVADQKNNTVTVINYQTGQNVKVLSASYGFSSPEGVVDGPNDVP